MHNTCSPILAPQHPMKKNLIKNSYLPPMGSVFPDFRTADAGQPVGLSVTVKHSDKEIQATEPVSVLLSRGPSQGFDTLPSYDAVRADIPDPVKDFMLFAPSILADPCEIDWHKYGWAPSSRIDGYHLRKLWIFPKAALVMDNIHCCYACEMEDLPYLSLVMLNPAVSNHETVDLADYVDALLEVSSTAAIPNIIEEWPEGVSRTKIPFSKINPDALKAPRN